MLEPAYFNQDKLYTAYKTLYTENSELLFYLYYPQKDFFPIIHENDSELLQFVSKDYNDKLLGFFTGYINKDFELLEKLEIINFTGKTNFIFSKDVERYFEKVFLYKRLRKIEFSCIDKNPSINLYRKLIKKLNGNVIGTFRDSVKLTDGKYYNNIFFEIFRDDFFKIINNNLYL